LVEDDNRQLGFLRWVMGTGQGYLAVSC